MTIFITYFNVKGHEIDEVAIKNPGYTPEQIAELVEDYAPMPGRALVEMGTTAFFQTI